jgi:hypothetical protein
MDLTHVFHLHFMHWRPRSLCDLHEALLANMSTGRCGSISARSLESEETDRPVAQATAIAMASEKIELKTQLAVDITTEHCPAVSDTPPTPGTDKQHDRSSTDQQSEDPQGWQLLAIITALCLAVFLVALDQTIVSTAIPCITDHFHSVNDIGW